MTIQQIIDTGQVDEHIDTALLEEAGAHVDQLLEVLRTSETDLYKAAIKHYQAVAGLLIKELNLRRGIDGMTPLTGYGS